MGFSTTTTALAKFKSLPTSSHQIKISIKKRLVLKSKDKDLFVSDKTSYKAFTVYKESF